MIKINNLHKYYNSYKALDSINLDIAAGEFIVLLGASGCGKTTLLNIIGGFEVFESGKISIDNINFAAQTKPKNCIKIFQDYALIPWLNALENVAFGLESSGIARIEARKTAKQYLKLVHLEGFESSFPALLSGGQKQRVALARALAVKPKILLLDEPFSALDNFTKIALQNELLNISKSLNTTSIFVTHDIEEAIFLGDRVIIMSPNPGKIVADIAINIDKSDRNSLEFLNLKREIALYLQTYRFNIEYQI